METELERLTRHADEAQERCVERCMERDIEAENAALWAFVRAWDFDEGEPVGWKAIYDIRDALRQYETTEKETTDE